ncbi:MAG: DUF6776 family protein, partial [Gammaproteobacteria bacterium]
HDAWAAAETRDRLAGRIRELDAENEALRWDLALLRTAGRVEQEGYQRVTGDLDDLQSQIAELKEELAFYRGIMSPADGNAGLQIQTVQISPGSERGLFRLRLVLVQAGSQSRRQKGTVQVTIEGDQGGETVRMPIAPLAEDGGDRKYSFQYFQILRQDVTLPRDFNPQLVEVVLQPSRKQDEPVTGSFPWRIVGN